MYFAKGYCLLHRGCIIRSFSSLESDYMDDVMGPVCAYDMIDQPGIQKRDNQSINIRQVLQHSYIEWTMYIK